MIQNLQYNRQTAYKTWVSDLVNNQLHKEDGDYGINYVLVRDKKISRVNLIGFIVEKYDNELNHVSLTLDDKSSRIKLKLWNDDVRILNNIDIGTFVLVIGKLRYNNEIYVSPEIVKVIDNPLWGKLRQLELTKLYGHPIKNMVVNANEENVNNYSENIRQNILRAIEKFDSGKGAHFDEVLTFVNKEKDYVSGVIDNLLKEGEIFKIGEGRFKIIG